MFDALSQTQGSAQHGTKRTKIVCTVGPATESDDVLRNMIASGMDVARLNFSHGDHEYHRKNIERVRRIAAELGKNVAIMTDTKGPEIRTRLNEGGSPIAIASGEELRITTADVRSVPGRIALDYEALPREVAAGDVIFIDDGLIRLEVTGVDGEEIACVASNGGTVGERKGVNVPTVKVGLPGVTERDRDDIRFSCEMGVDAIAASFVRDADAVREVRDLCREFGAAKTMVIAKVESAFAITNFDEILAASDGIMVARGDLGVEVPPADVPNIQREIIRRCNKACVPVITATQMLESMTKNPRPTRAEVTDVNNAIAEGTDCVMLSGETAAGAYPVDSVRMLADICVRAEDFLMQNDGHNIAEETGDVADTTGRAAVLAAQRVGAKAILCPTLYGRTARVMSSLRPRLPIIATSPVDGTLRQCCFYWGVECVSVPEGASVRDICASSLREAKRAGLVGTGDVVVITAGDALFSPMGTGAGVTSDTPANIMMIAEVM